MIWFCTGLDDYDHFCYVYHCHRPAADDLEWPRGSLSPKNQFLLTLIKLRRGKEDAELAFLFVISRVTVGRVFYTWLSFLYYSSRKLT